MDTFDGKNINIVKRLYTEDMNVLYWEYLKCKVFHIDNFEIVYWG